MSLSTENKIGLGIAATLAALYVIYTSWPSGGDEEPKERPN